MPTKTDIWMPLYIGDILADTSHLDAERFGCYMLWLMHYWRKGPLSGNIPDLVGIGKLRCSDAPSIAQALLIEFFVKNGDSKWHQKRADLEIAKWQDKSLKAQEKAKAAAEARWNKDAPSIPPSIPSSNAQAMLTPCPLPSPLPPSLTTEKPKRQKTSKNPKPEVDPRFGDFKQIFEQYFDFKNSTPAPWDGQEGSALKKWLAANPTITEEQWRKILRNRTKSTVAHGKRLSGWIEHAIGWLNGLADDWGREVKPNGNGANNASVSNGTGNAPLGVLEKTLARRQRQRTLDEDGDLSAGVENGRSDAGDIHTTSGELGPPSIPSRDEEHFEF